MTSSSAPRRPAYGWLWRERDWRGDLALALAVGALQFVGTHFAAEDQPDRRTLDALGFALVAVGPAALVLRRRWPGAVLLAAFCSTLAYWLLDYPGGPIFLSLIIALFSAVLAGQRLLAWLTVVAGYAAFPWLPYLLGNQPRPTIAGLVGLAAWLPMLVTAAEVTRMRRERALQARRNQQEEARRRASEERLRIARELHDVLAHNISLINVQAGVALHLIDQQPEQARSALAAIKQASKDTLGELGSVLDVLRHDDEALPRSPTSGLARLDELVARAEAAGLVVRTRIEGEPRPLPTGMDLAAFRIVQEALTNVTRHAGPATATVRVAYGQGELTVQVDDDGRGAGSPGAADGGNGIRGMRERATALGGRLEAGPRPAGGFRVLARLPLDGPR